MEESTKEALKRHLPKLVEAQDLKDLETVPRRIRRLSALLEYTEVRLEILEGMLREEERKLDSDF